MFSLECKKKGFTLAEVVIVCSLFAIIVVGIILAINRAFAFIDNTRLSVRATNLAREGIEMVYNIRDTNRRKCSGKRDGFWLYLGSGGDVKNCSTGGNVFGSGVYVIKEGNISGDKVFYANKLLSSASGEQFYSVEGFFGDTYSGQRTSSKINFTGVYPYYSGGVSGGVIATGEIEDLVNVSGLEFYRVLRVYGIYEKSGSEPNKQIAGVNGTPAEMRFCVKVFYQSNGGRRSSELCSIMTNFMK